MARRKAQYSVVLIHNHGDNEGLEVLAAVDGTPDGLKWIRANGQEGSAYKVISDTTGEVRVEVKTVRKVKVVPLASPDSKEAADASAPEA